MTRESRRSSLGSINCECDVELFSHAEDWYRLGFGKFDRRSAQLLVMISTPSSSLANGEDERTILSFNVNDLNSYRVTNAPNL